MQDEKFGNPGLGKICGLEDIRQIVTDIGIDNHIATTLQRLGME